MTVRAGRIRAALAAAALAITLAACGSSTPSPAGVTPSPPAPSPSATPAIATAPPSSPAPASSSPVPTGPAATGEDTLAPTPHDDPSLEALLPAIFRGTPLIRESARLDRSLGTDPSSQKLVEFLASQGKTPADLVVASAYTTDITFGLYLAAFRGAGIDPNALRDVLVEVSELAGPVEQVAKEVGGKRVLHVSDAANGLSSYLYTSQGVLYLVETIEEDKAAEVLAALP